MLTIKITVVTDFHGRAITDLQRMAKDTGQRAYLSTQ